MIDACQCSVITQSGRSGSSAVMIYNMTSSCNGASERKTKLNLEGTATHCTDKDMLNQLFDALQESTCLELNIEMLTEVDLSFLLLLCAIHRMSQLNGKKIIISGKLPAVSQKVADASWVVKEGSCLFDSSKRCILKGMVSIPANKNR